MLRQNAKFFIILFCNDKIIRQENQICHYCHNMVHEQAVFAFANCPRGASASLNVARDGSNAWNTYHVGLQSTFTICLLKQISQSTSNALVEYLKYTLSNVAWTLRSTCPSYWQFFFQWLRTYVQTLSVLNRDKKKSQIQNCIHMPISGFRLVLQFLLLKQQGTFAIGSTLVCLRTIINAWDPVTNTLLSVVWIPTKQLNTVN